MDRITESGEPLFPSDFNPPEIPDRENAAVLYEKAGQFIVDSGASKSSLVNKCFDLPADEDAFISTCGALVRENEGALALIREARSRPRVRWSLQIKSPLIDYISTPGRELRVLARLLRIKMKLGQLDHHDGESVRILEDILALAAAVDRYPSLISHLAALAIERLAIDAIEELGPDLAIGSAGVPVTHKSADRAIVERLIERLTNDDALVSGIVHAIQSERAMQLDVVLTMTSAPRSADDIPGAISGSNLLSWAQSPFASVFKLDGAAMLEHMSLRVQAVRSSSLPAHRECLASMPVAPWNRRANGIRQFQHILSQVLAPAFSRAIVLHYRLLSRRRMAAAALAIRLYELDNGHRPKDLMELVPRYLPQVPVDPMSSNGVIQYLPDAEFPRLYSIGPDGVDDGGRFVHKRGGKINWDAADSPFFLDSKPLPPSE